jgi:Phage tail tube protein
MPIVTSAVEERRIDGNYGEIFHEGKYQGDLASFTGRVAIERRTIQRAGADQVIYRRGTVSREGTFVVNKVDTRFEARLLEYANMTVDQRRALRDQGVEAWPETDFIVVLNDPDAWGAERIQITGVKLWEIAIGFAPGDLIERDLPATWRTEKILQAIGRPGNKQGAATYPNAQGAGHQGDPVW